MKFPAGMAASPLLWSNGVTARSVNSLTFDTTAGAQTVNLGAATTNVLTLTSGALQLVGANNGTLTGGQVGASNSELVVQQKDVAELVERVASILDAPIVLFDPHGHAVCASRSAWPMG